MEQLYSLQIQRVTNWDPSQSTVWLLCAKRDGIFFKALCVDALVEDFDFRYCELSKLQALEMYNRVAFYVQYGGQPARRSRDSVLLFCMLLDPQVGQLEYLGSILTLADSNLYSVCFIDLADLCSRLQNMECSFFVVKSETCTVQIRSFQRTVKEVRLPLHECEQETCSVL